MIREIVHNLSRIEYILPIGATATSSSSTGSILHQENNKTINNIS